MVVWAVIVLGPFIVFWLCVHSFVRYFNSRPKSGPHEKLDHSKLIPLWAETVLVGIPLVRYGILILGQMVFGLAEESWGDNKYPDVQAFRRWYPETFIGDGGFNDFLPTVLILLDTLFIFALPVLLVRLFQHFMGRRSHRERSVFPKVADKTVWPPPPNRPAV